MGGLGHRHVAFFSIGLTDTKIEGILSEIFGIVKK
jgi:hypothetical protein